MDFLVGCWQGLVNGINEVSSAIFNTIMALLPTSPFLNIKIPQELSDLMGYLNYYVPFSGMLTIGAAWISCILVFYGYQMLLRFIKAVK